MQGHPGMTDGRPDNWRSRDQQVQERPTGPRTVQEFRDSPYTSPLGMRFYRGFEVEAFAVREPGREPRRVYFLNDRELAEMLCWIETLCEDDKQRCGF